MLATLWFNIAHYALRPWPWILVALASLIVYPTLADIQARFPHLDPSIIRHDLAYPAMLVFVPHGLLGLVVAALAAAYMSTISTHLNWGASYVVDDVYRRFLRPNRSESHYVNVGRGVTVVLMLLACLVALWLHNAMQAFTVLLQIGAGTGLIFLLRWYWWRINAWGEIAAMVISFLFALYLHFGHARLGFAPLHPTVALVIGVMLTTIGWLAVTLADAANRSRRAAVVLRSDSARPGRLAPRRGYQRSARRRRHRGVVLGLVSRLRRRLRGLVRDRLFALRPPRHRSFLCCHRRRFRLRPLAGSSQSKLLDRLSPLS